MQKLLLFGEFIDSTSFSSLIEQKLHILNPLKGLGTYLQGIATQNTVDFIWGTGSGARSLPVGTFLGLFKFPFGEEWSKVYLIFIIILPIFGFIAATRLIKKIDLMVVVGGMFYGLNYWIINRIITGYWQLNLVYGLLPFTVTIPIYYLRSKNKNSSHILFVSGFYSILISIIAFAQPHFLIMILVFTLIHFIYHSRTSRESFSKLLKFYLTSLILYLLLNLYIIVPSVFFPETLFTAANQFFSIGSVIFNGQGAQLENILRLAPRFLVDPTPWTLINIAQLLPITITLLLFFLNKNKNWLFFSSGLIFILLAKGVNDPLAEFSKFLYQNIPLLHFFRDPSRFLAGAVLFMSLIIANYNLPRIKLSLKIIISIIVFTTLITLSSELNESLRKSTRPTFIPEEYLSMQKYINKISEKNYRILTIPNTQGMSGYYFYDNISPISSSTVFEMALPLSIPSADSSNYPDNYSSQVSSFAYNSYVKNFDISSLSSLSVKYLLLDTSIVKPQTEKDIATSSAQKMSASTDLSLAYKTKNLLLYTIKKTAPIVTIKKPIFTVGNLETITKIKDKNDQIPVILLNQKINSNLLNINLLKNENLILDLENPVLTLVAESLMNKFDIDILSAVWDWDKTYVNCEPYKMDYIKNAGNLFTSGRCVISTNKNDKVNIPTNLRQGNYKILVKALSVENPTQLKIKIGNKVFNNKLDTKGKLVWIDIGNIELTDLEKEITLYSHSEGRIVLDSILFVPSSEFIKTESEINNIFEAMNIINFIDLGKSTHVENGFKIKKDSVTLEKPSKYLTYRFTWGAQWKSNVDSIKFISDGYGMTFVSKGEDISSIYYPANMIYKVCIVLSLLIYLIIIAYLVLYYSLRKGSLLRMGAFKRYFMNYFYKNRKA